MANHKLTNKDVDLKLADCSECGPNVPMRVSYTDEASKVHWRCHTKYNSVKTQIERPWTVHKKDYCEWHEGCDFKIVHPCQLAVDHIDGNKQNNDPSNLQTLCHNHHALKTLLAGDHVAWRKVAAI